MTAATAAIDVAPDDFAELPARTCRQSGFAGGNVTIPHKEAAFAGVASRDEAAELIGAVNTLWLEDGMLCGGNTDVDGFAANLDQHAPDWRKAGAAVVLGAGGAARAVVLCAEAARHRATSASSTARSPAPSSWRSFRQRHFGASVSMPAGELLGDAGLLVNTTSLGMHGNSELPADPGLLPDHAIVTDIVYVPLETPLLAAAERRGLKTVDGLGMLLHQAVPGFERWFGVMAGGHGRTCAHLIVADIGQKT